MNWRYLAAVTTVGTALWGQAAIELRIDAAIDSIKSQVPGLTLAVMNAGRVAYVKAVGTTSIGVVRPPDGDTQFRLASLSKPMTAVAVFSLAEQGKIDLDKPAREYCPALAALDGAPTVRHLLLHQSGLRHTNDREDETITGAFPRLGPSLAGVTKEPLRFTPGRKTLYTSWGYTALGCVIEEVSGMSFADFIRERVLSPAQMTHTVFDKPDYTSDTFSPGFRMSGRFIPSLVVDTRFKTPASGIISTANDLMRFADALFTHRIISATSFADMLAVRPTIEEKAPMFTAGWTVGPSNLGTPGFNYNGSMEGSTAVLVLLPEKQIAVALLTNRERYVPGVMPVVGEALRATLGLPPK